MLTPRDPHRPRPPRPRGRIRYALVGGLSLAAFLWLWTLPLLAQSPWERAASNLELSFTGPLARSLALVAIVLGGLMFMFGEAGAKRQISGIVFGGGLALFAPSFSAGCSDGPCLSTEVITSTAARSTRAPTFFGRWRRLKLGTSSRSIICGMVVGLRPEPSFGIGSSCRERVSTSTSTSSDPAHFRVCGSRSTTRRWNGSVRRSRRLSIAIGWKKSKRVPDSRSVTSGYVWKL